LKHDPASPAKVKHAYAFGASQCGRFLRDFVYLGFNTDEQDRMALDGVMSHVAGAGRLVLNQRWSTPRAISGYYTASYPFADTAQKDPVSGHSEGILANPRVKHAPKIFYTNMAAEYWGAGRVGALTHTTPDGKQDIAMPENVRSYFFASTSHGAAPFPPTSQVKGSPQANPVNTSPAILALRLAMHRWVSDGTLVPVAEIRWPKVPGMASPTSVKAGGRVRNPQLPDGAGEGTELPLLVPQCDAEGNDLGGIRVPDVAVPLGTGTGWVFRPAEFGSLHEFYLLRGAWVPFAKTKVEREAANDPRPSLEERYSNKATYLDQVKAAAQKLIEQRFLTDADLEPQLKQASQRWDWVMRPRTK
jgi:Alpha/beta hydrolase domain